MAIYRDEMPTCPRCGDDVALSAVETPRLTRHACPRCTGVWIDEADLRRMLADLDFSEDEALGPLVTTTGTMPCLRCRRPMAVEHTHGDPQTEIDICPEHGAWFDREELSDALWRLQSERIAYQRRQSLEEEPDELAILIRIYRLFRPLEPPPDRRRGRP